MIDAIAHLGLLDDEDIELDLAALDLSALDHEGVDLDPYRALLQAMTERLAVTSEGAASTQDRAASLARVIGREYGFTGDRASYDAPVNADMIRVIDRRKGLPVSLSILYVAAARRMGWAAEALNTPGHVVVRIGEAQASVLIDPFGDGGIILPAQIVALLARTGDAAAAMLGASPLPNRLVLVRLLLNQASRAEAAGDSLRAMILHERMTVIAPSNGQGWWDLARLQLNAGRVDAARDSLSAMLEITRDPKRRGDVMRTLEALSGR